MKRTSVLLAGVAVALFLICGAVLAQAQPSKAVGPPDRYIVVLKKGVSDPGQAARGMARRYGLGVGFVYGHALKGFSATVPDGRLEKVRTDERVDYVERDGTMSAVGQILPWGVNRVDADTSSTRAGNGSGAVSNVHAYVIDTGIDGTHSDLRVESHVNFTDEANNKDCNGHGTHVAGTLAAKDNASDVVGVAPGAPLVSVKVLGRANDVAGTSLCGYTGSISAILAGINWVTANAQKPAVANLSFTGPSSPETEPVDEAVRKSAASGILYSVAAGNDGKLACNYSPADAGRTNSDGAWKKNNGIVTTAATIRRKKNDPPTVKNNSEWPESNYGACVDLWAPGASILSTKLGGGTKTMSGTSMASPHVGGGGALYLRSHTSASPSSVEAALKGAAWRPGTKSKDGRTILLENVDPF